MSLLVRKLRRDPRSTFGKRVVRARKGAFTGADKRRIGKFEECHGGTILLDEVGDMSPLVQGKVLRLLQDQCFQRLGGNETIHTDVRVLSATNRDLESLIVSGEFRQTYSIDSTATPSASRHYGNGRRTFHFSSSTSFSELAKKWAENKSRGFRRELSSSCLTTPGQAM